MAWLFRLGQGMDGVVVQSGTGYGLRGCSNWDRVWMAWLFSLGQGMDDMVFQSGTGYGWRGCSDWDRV